MPLDSVGARLQQVLGDRSAWKWARAVGLTPGTVGRMIEGHLPGAEKLIPAARMENLSLTWLCTGEGTPFLLTPIAADADARALVEAAVTDTQWQVEVLACSDRYTIVLHAWQEDVALEGKLKYRWRRVKLLAGASLGHSMLNGLHSPPLTGPARIHHSRIQDDKWQQLVTGQIGTFGLFGDADHAGLVNHSGGYLSALPVSSRGAIAEEHDSYKLMDTDTAEAVDIIHSAKPVERQTILRMIRGLRSR